MIVSPPATLRIHAKDTRVTVPLEFTDTDLFSSVFEGGTMFRTIVFRRGGEGLKRPTDRQTPNDVMAIMLGVKQLEDGYKTGIPDEAPVCDVTIDHQANLGCFAEGILAAIREKKIEARFEESLTPLVERLEEFGDITSGPAERRER